MRNPIYKALMGALWFVALLSFILVLIAKGCGGTGPSSSEEEHYYSPLRSWKPPVDTRVPESFKAQPPATPKHPQSMHDDVYDEGYDEGYEAGFSDGQLRETYQLNYDEGSPYDDDLDEDYEEGYDDGYEQGYLDACP